MAGNSIEFGANSLLEPEAVAKLLRKSVTTLLRWRCNGFGPAFIKIGGTVAYHPTDIEAFLPAQRREGTGASVRDQG